MGACLALVEAVWCQKNGEDFRGMKKEVKEDG